MNFDIILQTPPAIAVSITPADVDNVAVEGALPIEVSIIQNNIQITLSEVPAIVGTLFDGNKGDITVANGGTLWTLNKTFTDGIVDDNDVIKLDIMGLQTLT